MDTFLFYFIIIFIENKMEIFKIEILIEAVLIDVEGKIYQSVFNNYM